MTSEYDKVRTQEMTEKSMRDNNSLHHDVNARGSEFESGYTRRYRQQGLVSNYYVGYKKVKN